MRRPWLARRGPRRAAVAAVIAGCACVLLIVAPRFAGPHFAGPRFATSRFAAFRGPEEATVLVTRAPLTFRVKAQGTLESANSAVVSPPTVREQWNFSITYLAPEGRPIEAGQPAVAFDAKRQYDQLEVQSAELAAARKELEKSALEEQERLDQLRLDQADIEARLGKLRRKLDVPPELFARGELERARLEAEEAEREGALNEQLVAVQERNLKAKVEAATSKVARLEARVTDTREAVRRLTVAAPRAGFVVYVPDWNNKKLAVGNTVWAGQQILEIADLARMQVAAVVPERDAGKVRAGQPVEIRLDANPDRLFRGRVATLGRVFRTKSWDKPSIVFDATVTIDDPDPELLRPGMAAEVTILAETEGPVVQVPEAAVRYDADGAALRVRAAAGGPRTVRVALGRRSDQAVEVLEGVEAGAVVLLAGAGP